MMYQAGLVAVVKANGQVLRENKDVVLLPFGSEYSLLIKNLKSKRVMVKVTIDGEDVFGGDKLVINANSEVEVERFVRNGNLNQGNRFKFIERTGEIEEHRGIKVDDGIIRLEYWEEKPVVWNSYPVVSRPYISYGSSNPRYAGDVNIWNTALKGTVAPNHRSFDSIDGGGSEPMRGFCSSTVNYSASVPISANYTNTSGEEGITVPGSVSDQRFNRIDSFPTESHSEVIVLKLRGYSQGMTVNRPITVNTKLTCPTCGRVSSSRLSYCPKCGTALHRV